jgi:hypothetical protein
MTLAEDARTLPVGNPSEAILDELDEVLIVGRQPGPALWQVKSGTNVLWVLATPPLVSKDLKWRSKQVEKVLADTQEVLAQYGTGNIPKSAIPPELRDRKNNLDSKKYWALINQTRYLPEGQTLRDVLPPDVYASFETARAAFPVRDKNLEKEGELERSRPDWARNLLSTRARLALNLTGLPVTDEVVGMAKRRKIKVTSVEYQGWSGYIIPIPATIESAMNMCPLDALLQGLEGRGARWKARANAWAVGNVKRMRELLRPLPIRIPKCVDREASRTESREKWLAAMELSLANNRSTLAVVDASALLTPGGLLDALRSRGYEVVEP